MYACCIIVSLVFFCYNYCGAKTKVVTSGIVGRMAEKESEFKEGLGSTHPTRGLADQW